MVSKTSLILASTPTERSLYDFPKRLNIREGKHPETKYGETL